MKPVDFAEAAELDVAEAKSKYRSIRPDLGDSFVAEIQSLCDRISVNPEMYQPFDADCRRGHLHRFQYAVAYRVLADSIQIVSVLPHRFDSATHSMRAHTADN